MFREYRWIKGRKKSKLREKAKTPVVRGFSKLPGHMGQQLGVKSVQVFS